MKYLLTLAAIFLVSSGKAQISFIAHRGASYVAPENTVAAAKLAWELGADAVELDIHLSKDNRIMVIHDGNTKRTTGQDMNVAETTADELRQLDAGSFKNEKYRGEKIPFLEEMIETVPSGKKLVIEIKCGKEILPFLKEIVEKSGKKEQLTFIAFDWQTIADVKKLFPENNCYWLSSVKDGLAEKIKEASEIGLDGLDLHYTLIDDKTVQMARKLNLTIVAWTVDSVEEAQRLKKLQIQGITSNRPDWLKEQL
jgi:glycerophosphoryl diester phosphodiesterase